MSVSAESPETADVNGDVRAEAAPASTEAPAAETIRALTATVESLAAQIATKDRALQEATAQVAERDRRVQQLQQQAEAQAAERTELARQHQDALAANASRIAELEAMVQQRDQRLTAQEWEAAALRSEVVGLKQTVEELEGRLADIYTSRTWLLSKKVWSARTRVRKLIR
jgi:chromosome segregation ATPase